MKVVTRFAPSPTGHLHIGGGRTAIFCWLLARHFGGEFRLRIEDTDTERSKQEYTDSILASMKWLGLDWDGDLTYQSQRKDVYNKYVDKLLETGHAYYCDCSVEEVEAMREVARAKGEKPRYNGKCRERGLGYAEGRVVRLKVPAEGRVVFDDMVKGPIAVDVNELDDMVLRRADGMPTYNMAVVVDDYEMGVTHVVRGDDHVSNTPKQILIYQALGLAVPTFGHVPMILGPDKQKLSKRHGARAVVEYQQDGLLPEALVNYLVRLGWSHGDQEIFSLQELVKLFDGKNLNSSAAAFDPDKLQWLNGYYLKHTPLGKAVELTRPFIEKSGLSLDGKNAEAAISLYIERASNLNDLAEQVKPYLQNIENVVFEEKALNALDGQGKEQIKNVLALVRDTEFTAENLEHVIHDYVETSGVKFKLVGTPLRSALIGLAGGPSIHLIMFALGKAETIKRLERVLA
jgi:glutamyl-tRNA synthetase, bacterial family